MRRSLAFGYLPVLLGVAGCFPATMTIVPELRGRVIDQQGRPVPGAVVEVFTDPDSQPIAAQRVSLELAADADGKFFRKEQVRWVMRMIPGDVFPGVLLVRARSADAESAAHKFIVGPGMELFGLWREHERADVEDLRLQPPPPP